MAVALAAMAGLKISAGLTVMVVMAPVPRTRLGGNGQQQAG